MSENPEPGESGESGQSCESGGTAPVAKAIVHLVRHGEVANPRGILYGRLPGYRLSEDGQMMAKAAADFLAGRDVTVLRSSPLERAIQTAEPIAEQLGLTIEIDERLIEPWNHFEGLNVGVGDGSLRAPRHWIYLRNPFRPSWGEPYREVAARMLAAATDAARAARGHEAVCVSHQLPIWVTRRAVEGRQLWHDPRRRQCSLGSITSLEFTGDHPSLISYSEPSGSAGSRVAGA
jgi:broad specificity phosphatase PhoE